MNVPTGSSSDHDPQETDRFRAVLLRIALGILKDRALAEDVVQTTFARWIEHRGGVEPGKTRSWLYSVATNEALAIKRTTQRRGELLRQVPPRIDPVSPERQAIDAELKQVLRRQLAALPESQLEIVRRRIFEGKKFIEIAQELDLPLGTVLTRMRRALRTLQAAMNPEPDDLD